MHFLQTISTKCFVILTTLVFCSSKSGLENRSFKIDTDKTSPQASIEIREGKEHEEFIRPPLAKTTELSKVVIETHLARLEPMPEGETEQDFAIRETSKPAPRTGVTVESEFPSASDLAPPSTHLIDDNVPLTVLRFAPQGSVELAPHVSITFSRPMVEITSQADAVKNIPVTLEPQPKGAWRWMGTRTLIFEPERETLPQATHYQLTIDDKATSTDGKRINGEKTFSFSTPPVKIKTHFPFSSRAANPANVPIFIEFNQRIDQQSIAEMIQVRVDSSSASFRIGNPDELSESFTNVKKMVENAGENKWILLFMDETLPPSKHITVTLKKGARSLEGPIQTSADQSFRFRSFYPLTIKNHSCDDKQSPCTPEQVWFFAASNALDTSNFDPSMVKITPEVEGLEVFVRGTSVLVTGYKTPQTKFVVELSREIRDRFGQNLSGSNKFTLFVGNAFPGFLSHNSQMSIVDPFASPSVRVNTVNYQTLAVEVWRVKQEHWSTYSNIRQNRWHRNKHNFLKQIPGQKVASTTVKIDGELNRLTETQIDLSKHLPQGKGHLIVWVSPASYMKGVEKSMQSDDFPQMITWLQTTNIGLDAWTDPTRLLVMATSLDEGKPLSDIKITAGSKQGTTRKDGSATFDLPNSSSSVLLATQGKDSAFLPMSLAGKLRSDQALFHVFDDRSMYRPGENVHVKGWVRKISQQVGADIEYPDADSRLTYNVTDSRNNEIAKGSASLSSLGGFDFSFDIPSTPNLGHAYIHLKVGEFSHTHTFQIQEFRTPEFEVNTNAGTRPHFAGEEFVSKVSGTYYSGGGLSGAPVKWYLRTSKASFTPPNRQEFSFGEQLPWFWGWYRLPNQSYANAHKTFTGTTDFSGNHTASVKVKSANPPGPMSLKIQASVTDVNRQRWTSSTNILIHPASYYVGLKTKGYYYEPKKAITIDWIVADVDGGIIGNVPVNIKAERFKNTYLRGVMKEELAEIHESRLISKTEASEWKFTPEGGGTWKITAVLVDEKDRHNHTAIRRWVRDTKIKPQKRVETQALMIFPDKDSYKPGDTAKLLIQTPFAPAEGVVLLQRYGFEQERRITFTETSKEITIPIKDRYTPNLHVQVHVSGIVLRAGNDGTPDSSLPVQPALAKGTINLSIPPTSRTLDVVAKPDKTALSPGESTDIKIHVKDDRGRPVPGAEVAVVVVDEAILALSNYKMSDPVEVFYNTRPALVSASHNRPFVVLAHAKDFTQSANPYNIDNVLRGTAGLKAGGGGRVVKKSITSIGYGAGLAKDETVSYNNIAIRSDFNPLAAFHPAGLTDKKGKLSVNIKLPDNLTRYRIMVIAADGPRRFGTSESNMTARLPLMVRPSPPRFLNFGDTFELPVVLQNQTDKKMTVELVSRAQNVNLKAQGYKVEVPANDRVEVRFPASTMAAGTARFQIAASTAGFADATSFDFPVWTPATSEAFATCGTLDKGAISHVVKRPDEIWPQFGGVQVSTSSTALQALTDAFIYLYNYQFSGSEQLASRIISIAALQDVLQSFDVAEIPSSEQIKKQMEKDIKELASRQNQDGGFGFWRPHQTSYPFSSLHVIHALTRAQAKGYKVPEKVRQRANSYTANIERYIPDFYSSWARRTVIAYSLYVRAVGGDFDEVKARSLLKETTLEEWSIGSLGWILYTLSNSPQSTEVNSIISHLQNRVHETASTAQFTQDFSEQDYHLVFHSSRRADAVVLEGLMRARPKSDLIPKLVRGLLANRKAGRWGNTQENGFVLLALDSYFKKFESRTPDFIARAWLGSQYAGEHTFSGRTTETHQINVPMHYLADEDSSQNLVLQKDGKGRMYYRIGMNYAPKSLTLDPADHGFHVERNYEGMDDKEDVVHRKDGVWEIRAGAKIKVTVKMVASGRRYHVALVDPLPAGLEALNPAIAVTGELPQESSQNRFWWWSRPWYEHQNMRNERVEAFSSLVYGGVYEYVYYARATTPGNFVVPPAKAEEMYAPETFGRSGTDRVIVFDR